MKELVEDLKKQVELLVKDDESSQQTIINQRQEIERLNNIIELALDYLDNGYCYCKDKKIPKPYFDYQELVNILKGSDKE